MKKSVVDLSAEELDKFASEAWASAATEAYAKGLPVTGSRDGERSRLHSDGAIEKLGSVKTTFLPNVTPDENTRPEIQSRKMRARRVVAQRILRVLLIEDDRATAQSIELMLKSESLNVHTIDLGEEGVDLGKLYDYDIILLDLNLPDMAGYELLRTLRVSRIKTPILILSGLAGIEDKVKGLGFGADDYMTKPFHKGELIAHIYAIVRRSKGDAWSEAQIA